MSLGKTQELQTVPNELMSACLINKCLKWVNVACSVEALGVHSKTKNYTNNILS